MKLLTNRTYGVVKSYGIKGTLLSNQALQTLAEAKDLYDLMDRLRGTIYLDFVSKIEKPFQANKFEFAFKEHLAFIHNSLVKSLPHSEILSAYYLKYISWNLKTIFKGKALEKEYNEILNYIDLYAEELIGRRDLVVKALAAKNLSESVEILKTSGFEEVQVAFNIFKEKNEMLVFDTLIDKAFYKKVLEAYKKMKKSERKKCKPIISVDIDSYNVLAVLRAKLWQLQASQTKEFLVEPIFDVSSEILNTMMESESITLAVKNLEKTNYRAIIQDITNEKEIISKLENAFALLGYEKAKYPFLWNIFSISTALGIIKLKEFEVQNLSSIAFGVEQGVEIQRMMNKIIPKK